MSLLLKTHLDLAKTSLKERRGRTFLTCLGIAIGVASIILILSLMGSINHLIKTQVNAIGGNLIIIRPSDKKDRINNILTELTSTNHFNKSNLTITDAQKIQTLNPTQSTAADFPVISVAPLATSINALIGDRTVESASVLGTTKELQSLIDLKLRTGTFLSDQALKTAVVGKNLSLKLFGTWSQSAKPLPYLVKNSSSPAFFLNQKIPSISITLISMTL